MHDCERLAKLLRRLRPATSWELLTEEFRLRLPVPDPAAKVGDQRAALERAVTDLDFHARQPLEEAADHILVLTDGPGQDVMTSLQGEIFAGADRLAFAACPNQYERATWLYRHERALFERALHVREADILRQSTLCYAGFQAPAGLDLLEDAAARTAFQAAAAETLGCRPEAMLVEIFRRPRAGAKAATEVTLFQVTVHHNGASELIEYIADGRLETQDVTRVNVAHITYAPDSGCLEVLSRHTAAREALARITADHLLSAAFAGEQVPIKQYDYQCLARPYRFDLSDEPEVVAVKVTEVGVCEGRHRRFTLRSGLKDPGDIHAAAVEILSPGFALAGRRLDHVILSVRLRKVCRTRARTVVIVLRGENRCNIKTKREKDRALCDRLLAKWKLVKEVSHDNAMPVHARAA